MEPNRCYRASLSAELRLVLQTDEAKSKVALKILLFFYPLRLDQVFSIEIWISGYGTLDCERNPRIKI